MDLFEDTDFYGKKLQVSFDEVKNLQLVLERKINEGQFQEFRVYDFSNIETVFHVFFSFVS